MGKIIVVLEDDEGIREVMHLILSLEDYEIASYESVKQFVNREGSPPDLYILDVMLPDGNGIDVCRDLKSVNKNVPVLMMSANVSRNEIEHACLADSYLEKPFDINRLLDKVRSLVEMTN
ncbi:response regulator transcription factor [Pedobacter lithocola]|uniref:Response regulator transcription factor n=1 Tax=Pedobacter lithocola TaxID=1908239 RepID=A0ABV8PFJ1_9SPHI